jgi:hypothetical protein
MARFVRVEGTVQSTLRKNFGATDEKVVIGHVDRRPTAQESVHEFFNAIQKIKSGKFHTDVDALHQQDVGLRCQGRSASYDLMWFASAPGKVYAFDSRDTAYIYILELEG